MGSCAGLRSYPGPIKTKLDSGQHFPRVTNVLDFDSGASPGHVAGTFQQKLFRDVATMQPAIVPDLHPVEMTPHGLLGTSINRHVCKTMSFEPHTVRPTHVFGYSKRSKSMSLIANISSRAALPIHAVVGRSCVQAEGAYRTTGKELFDHCGPKQWARPSGRLSLITGSHLDVAVRARVKE